MQLTTDGYRVYLDAVADAFGGEIDYAQLVKVYAGDPNAPKGRYSPTICIAAERNGITGNPDLAHVSTS